MIIGTIFRKEILEKVLELKLLLGFSILLILFPLSALLLHGEYEKRMEAYELEVRSSGEEAAPKRASPLSMIVKGTDQIGEAYEPINPMFQLFGQFDFLYLFQMFISLMAIIMACDLVCGEYERGTLRLICSNPVSRSSVLLAKLSGGYASFLIPFLLISLESFLILHVVSRGALRGADMTRFGGIVLIGLIYAAVFFNLGMLISTCTHRSSTATMLALFTWASLVFVVPNLGVVLARSVVRPPSSKLLGQRKRLSFLELRERAMEGKISWQEFETERSGAQEQLDEWYENRMDRLVELTKQWVRISPSGCVTLAASSLAGTGIEGWRHWKAWKHRQIEGQMTARMRPRIRASFQESLTELAVLLVVGLLLFLGAYMRFLRYDLT